MSDDMKDVLGQEGIGLEQAGIGFDSAPKRIVRQMDITQAIQEYVSVLMPWAAKNKYPQHGRFLDPRHAHEFTVVDDRLVLWLVPGSEFTTVQFVCTTEDGISIRVQEQMELASSGRVAFMKKEVEEFVQQKRQERKRDGRQVATNS